MSASDLRRDNAAILAALDKSPAIVEFEPDEARGLCRRAAGLPTQVDRFPVGAGAL